MRASTRLLATIGLSLFTLNATADTVQDWQLSHGGFVTASDVRAHNGLPQDRADMLDALAQTPPNFGEALVVFAFGRNFPWKGRTNALGRFTDNYNGAIPDVLPLSVAHFGTPSFQMNAIYSALAGTAGYPTDDTARRTAFVDGGTLAAILNWTRFELAMSRRKALAATPNWALKNGSPKNWNEIFAFHFGPEGQHSIHAALEAVDGGPQINAALYAALAAGQPHLLEERWAAEEAAEVARLLHLASLRLFHNALMQADSADDAARPQTVAYASGLWLAASEAILTLAPSEATIIEAALEGAGDPAQLGFAADAVAAAIEQLGA